MVKPMHLILFNSVSLPYSRPLANLSKPPRLRNLALKLNNALYFVELQDLRVELLPSLCY